MISPSEILKASILIVDDQEAHSSLLEQILRGAGYVSITTTNDPHEVCELYRKNRYALILLDLQMPEMDGFQVMEGLKEVEAGGYLPVLVLTAQPNHKLQALKAGAKDFLSKPFDLPEVLMRVHNLLEVRLLHMEAEKRTKEAENSEREMRASELSYRRLFEAAQDGILILEVGTGRITDVNPFLFKLLGFSKSEMVGKTVGELSPFKDIGSNQAMLERLQQHGYARYEDLPMETKDGRKIAVEFVSNVYQVGDKKVIQCNIRDITERKQAEKERQRVGRQMELLLESAVEGIYGVDLEGRCMFINRAACEILGCKAEQVLGRNMHDLKHHHRKDGSVYPFEQCPTFRTLRNNESSHVDDEVFWKMDGTSFPVEYSSRPIFQGAVVAGAVVTFTDITERKRAEEVLRGTSSTEKGRQTKKAFRDLAVIVVLSVFIFVASYRSGLSNESFSYLVSHDKGVGTFLDEAIFTLVFVCLALLVFSYRRWKESRAETLSQTQVTNALGLLHGEMETRVQQRTAELVNSNEALQKEFSERKLTEARFRRLVESNAQGVIFWNTKGQVTVANDAFLQLLHYSREDLEARRINWLAMTPPDYAHLDRRAIEEIAANGVCKPYEKEFICKDGLRVPVLLGAASFQDNPDEGVCFIVDLTERKKLENQFLRAQRMESIGTLAGGIAHDLNNILAPIMMSIDILKLTTQDPQSKTILETIEISAKRGAAIVRQVLSFARGIEGERTEIQPKHLLKDLESIIKDTFPKDIRLQFSIPEETWTILGDPTQVHQILLNLCVNARDAMPNGGNLTVSVQNSVLDDQYVSMNIQAKVGRYVNITVTDSGTGMPPGIVDKIFEPFFTTKEVNKGTGLGLSTVMAIVKSHEGVINVYSEPGKGTVFNVYLPAMEISTEVQKELSEEASLPRGNGETVLLVDDEASILIITSQTLQAFGYRVLTATDGAEAVAIYAQHPHEIAVVLTDMMMPIMDGSATIRALTKIDPAIKIIAVSGLNANSGVAKVPGIGVKYFLTKPYTAGTLLKTIRMILDEV